jgi:hypothetical protein
MLAAAAARRMLATGSGGDAMRSALLALAIVTFAGAAQADSTYSPLTLVQGTWKIVSAPGVFGAGGRLSIDQDLIVYEPKLPPHMDQPRIVDVAALDDFILIKLKGGGLFRLRRETPDRLCGWGPTGNSPVVDMRTELTRANPPVCLVRLGG